MRHLNQAYAEGRLSLEEFDDRSSAAYRATFDDELRALLHDLPDAQHAVAAPVDTVELRTDSATIKRTGDWAVPRRLRVTSASGTVRLDFTEARVPFPVVDVELTVDSGTTVIILPRGGTADLDGVRTDHGTIRSRVPARPEPGVLHVRVSGYTMCGTIKVRQGRR